MLGATHPSFEKAAKEAEKAAEEAGIETDSSENDEMDDD